MFYCTHYHYQRAGKKKKRSRQRSTSLSQAADALKKEEDDAKYLRLEPIHSENMLQNLKKYNKEEQQDLVSIQLQLRKWIGSEHQHLILSQFLDLMKKIAPHVSTAQATNMFNQMDPANNGQIATSLLLHDEFLPRMILNLFQVEETQSQSESDEDHDEDYQNMEAHDLISSIKRMKKETQQLKDWIVEHGQPALEKVDEMQRMLDVYEAERTHKQSELQSFKKRLSTLDVLEQQLRQTETHSQVLRERHNYLLLTVQESAEKHEIERKKYNAALREAMEYRRLNKELHQLNDQYSKKIDGLREKQMDLEDKNQNLCQIILQHETELQQVDEYKNKMASLESDLQQYEKQSLEDDLQQYSTDKGKTVRWEYPDEERSELLVDRTFSPMRKRRMTLNDPETLEEGTLDSEIEVLRTRRRRNTIKLWYEAYSLRANSLHSVDTNEEGTTMMMNADLYDNDISLHRQDSEQSQVSTLPSVAPLIMNNATTPFGVNTPGANVFGEAYTQEIKKELKQKIEEEMKEDYELKLKQRDIQHKMELHKEKLMMEEEQRKFREKYEKKINELNATLTQYEKQKKNDIQLDMENDEMVYLKNMNDGHITDLSSDDEEKEVFDGNMPMMDYVERENENQPLINKAEREEQLTIEEQLRENEIEDARIERATKDEACLSCFGLLTGRGPWRK